MEDLGKLTFQLSLVRFFKVKGAISEMSILKKFNVGDRNKGLLEIVVSTLCFHVAQPIVFLIQSGIILVLRHCN